MSDEPDVNKALESAAMGWVVTLVVVAIVGVLFAIRWLFFPSVNIDDLEAGMCLRWSDESQGFDRSFSSQQIVERVDVEDCDAPHTAEVLAAFESRQTARLRADNDCDDEIPALERVPDSAGLSVLVPDSRSWNGGDRTVVCLAIFSAPITYSIIAN